MDAASDTVFRLFFFDCFCCLKSFYLALKKAAPNGTAISIGIDGELAC